jgi:hypothetical protein
MLPALALGWHGRVHIFASKRLRVPQFCVAGLRFMSTSTVRVCSRIMNWGDPRTLQRFCGTCRRQYHVFLTRLRSELATNWGVFRAERPLRGAGRSGSLLFALSSLPPQAR